MDEDTGHISWSKHTPRRGEPDYFYEADQEPDEREHPLDAGGDW